MYFICLRLDMIPLQRQNHSYFKSRDMKLNEMCVRIEKRMNGQSISGEKNLLFDPEDVS